MIVALIAPVREADVGDFRRGNDGVCWGAAKIIARSIDDAALGIRHFTRGGVANFILDDAVKDRGVTETHHDVVRFQVGVDDMTFSVEVVEALE